MRIILTGGGTAGHINPAIALAQIIQKHWRDCEILFVGTQEGKESILVPKAGYPIRFIRSTGLTGGLSSVKSIFLAFKSPSDKETVSILANFRPDLVIATGGYACWPIVRCAQKRKIPTILHESNAIPGIATGLLHCGASEIWTNFEGKKQFLPWKTVIHTGNPLRAGFAFYDRNEARKKLGIPLKDKRILCFGGSLGSLAINRAMLLVLNQLNERSDIHLSVLVGCGLVNGEEMLEAFETSPVGRNPKFQVKEYIDDMYLQMASADCIISRCGAITLSELSKMRKPAILVPSPNVKNNHQYKNAKRYADHGAGILVTEDGNTEHLANKLLEAIDEILNNRQRRAMLKACIADFDVRQTEEIIVKRLEHYLGDTHE